MIEIKLKVFKETFLFIISVLKLEPCGFIMDMEIAVYLSKTSDSNDSLIG